METLGRGMIHGTGKAACSHGTSLDPVPPPRPPPVHVASSLAATSRGPAMGDTCPGWRWLPQLGPRKEGALANPQIHIIRVRDPSLRYSVKMKRKALHRDFKLIK